MSVVIDGKQVRNKANPSGTNVLCEDGVYRPNGAGGGLTLTTIEVSVSSVPRKAGKFSITGAGFAVGKPVLIAQASGSYTGKGTRADEAEMDGLTVKGKTTSATNIDCYWNSPTFVKGNFKFDYAVSG